MHYSPRWDSFRPLAGFWFLKNHRRPCTKGGRKRFPSPCGVLVLKWKTTQPYRWPMRCFRPLAGVPYLSFPRRYGGSGEQREPMGALVPCVHFCRYGRFTACVHGAPSTAYAVPLPRSGRGGWRYAPSPCGGLVLKFLGERAEDRMDGAFPSPCGVLVLKSKYSGISSTTTTLVSVPLRGSGS